MILFDGTVTQEDACNFPSKSFLVGALLNSLYTRGYGWSNQHFQQIIPVYDGLLFHHLDKSDIYIYENSYYA